MQFKVKIKKKPTKRDWAWAKECALNTVGKESLKEPTDDWKEKLILAEHSPLRELWFGIRMEIPYYVSVHYVRHNVGCNHYVQSQRNDRQKNYDRTKAPQDAMVSHIMSVNAQELVFIAHKRLCNQADPYTKAVMEEIVRQVVKVCPEFKKVLVPLCKYRNGKCTEFYPCWKNKEQK